MKRAATLLAVLVLLLSGIGGLSGRARADTLRWHTGTFGTSMGYADRQPYIGAARFTPDFGCTLSLVRWYQSGDAATAQVSVWGPGTEDEPGALLEESVPGPTGEEQWHEAAIPGRHRFPPNQDFWVGVRFAGYTVGGGKYPFGADPGPQVPPKRSLYASRDGDSWYHISPPPQQYDRNWLLDAVVRAESLTGLTEGATGAGARRFSVGPNPLTGGIATLRTAGRTAGGTVRVFSADGRCVLTRPLSDDEPSTGIRLDLKQVADGVYIVRLETAGHAYTRQLVVRNQ